MMDPKSRGLGRGLNALFEDDEDTFSQIDPEGDIQGRKKDMVGIDQLQPGQGQPRTVFDDEALSELAVSIKRHGVLQPLLVREYKDGGGQYEIIAGERRWRAAQKAQLHEVPVIVLTLNDLEAFEVALIENLQREDLDPIDEAAGYQRLMSQYEYTQEKLAESLGKSRSHIANMIRLLQLPEPVQKLLSEGKISSGHARALVTAKNPEMLAKEVVSRGLSVRETEKLAAEAAGRQAAPSAKGKKTDEEPYHKDVDTIALEQELSNVIGMRVGIDSRDGKAGKVTINFKSLDQLDDVIQRLAGGSGGPSRLSQ